MLFSGRRRDKMPSIPIKLNARGGAISCASRGAARSALVRALAIRNVALLLANRDLEWDLTLRHCARVHAPRAILRVQVPADQSRSGVYTNRTRVTPIRHPRPARSGPELDTGPPRSRRHDRRAAALSRSCRAREPRRPGPTPLHSAKAISPAQAAEAKVRASALRALVIEQGDALRAR
jgi:hypothetical protein